MDVAWVPLTARGPGGTVTSDDSFRRAQLLFNRSSILYRMSFCCVRPPAAHHMKTPDDTSGVFFFFAVLHTTYEGFVLPAVRATVRAWKRYEGPTWLVAIAVYGGWFALTWWHATLPWWAILRGRLAHCLARIAATRNDSRTRSRAAADSGRAGKRADRTSFPYGSYRRDHRRHHSGDRLTEPDIDPESFYHTPERWLRYPLLLRGIYRANQTLLGRLAIGCSAPSRAHVLCGCAPDRFRRSCILRDWLWHLLLVAAVMTWVIAVAAMPGGNTSC